MKAFLTAAVSGLLLMSGAAGAQAAASAKPERALGVEASIPFADSVGIRDFRPDGDKALWIQGQDRQWYRAELMSKCWGLDYALKVGFVTRGVGSLDKFGQILVDGSKCQISSLTTSAPPPVKAKPVKAS